MIKSTDLVPDETEVKLRNNNHKELANQADHISPSSVGGKYHG